MLVVLGEDPDRPGLRRTPMRVEAAYRWLTRGYHHSVAEVVGRGIFEESHENMILVRDIDTRQNAGPEHLPQIECQFSR